MSFESVPSARRLRELFENIPDGVYETSPEGQIIAANQALVRMLGFSCEEELKRHGAANFYMDPAQRQINARVLAETGRLVNAELQLRRRDGSILHVLENARAVRDDAGAVVCYQGTLTDITERKKTEEELRQARDAALEASRLKSRFLANISHELRTPLNAVLGMSQIMLSMQCSDEIRNCAETIHMSAKMLLDHITEILDFSRIEAGRMEMQTAPFNLREVIHQTASMLGARAADKGLTLLAWAEPGVPAEVEGDPARLQQVLVNLLSNAVKFTGSGEVELTVRCMERSDRRCRLRFAVRDTGPGIPASATNAIFEPFRQVDDSTTRRHGGTGLGLAIVREIVEAMNSRVELRSEPGQGSEFSFEAEFSCEASEDEPAINGGVLLLEPNASIRRMMETWLRSWGISTFVVEDEASLADALRKPDDVQRLRAVVANEAALSPDQEALWRLLDREQGEGPGLILLAGWAPGSRSFPSSQPGRAVHLRTPVCETELRLAIARAGNRPSGSLQALAEATLAHSPKWRILVAEDNAVNQVVVRRMIEKLGYSLEIAADGRAAVDAAMREKFDLILMDCQMPEMDGFRATAAIRAAEPPGRRIPIIAITAHASAEDEQACLSAGMDDYLSKPLMLNTLAEKLRFWLSPDRVPAEH